ncbi:MAG: cobalamin-binding protein [Gammaproteobacteria bacterium]|nr:cobalamin-binding protein [Gammaproteobacteria bacterium]
MDYPARIVCLTEETTETLYLLGEQRRIVGISGFTVRPAQARKEKPKVSAFTSAKIDKILELEPDLILGFSNLQADVAAQLIRAGIAVHVFNQRSVEGILRMISLLGAMVGVTDKAAELAAGYRQQIKTIQSEATATALPFRPKVYFEEWDEPMISGIRWVSELIAIAGGVDCFAELSTEQSAKQRIIADPLEVVRRAPDIIIGSWCGKKFRHDHVAARAGWDVIPAVKNNQLFEVKSCDILQPGPAALTDGLAQIRQIIRQWLEKNA